MNNSIRENSYQCCDGKCGISPNPYHSVTGKQKSRVKLLIGYFVLILGLTCLSLCAFAQTSVTKQTKVVTTKDGAVLTVYVTEQKCNCKGTAKQEILDNTITWSVGKNGGLYCMRKRTRGENKGTYYKQYFKSL